MATNYPTWDTWDGHGCPITGHYWGDNPVSPSMSETAEHEVIDQGTLITIKNRWDRDSPRMVTMPRTSEFWWSSDLPSIQWWGERDAGRRREIADQNEMLAITAGSNLPPGEYVVDGDPWQTFIGSRVTVRMPAKPTQALPGIERNLRLAEERMQTMPIDHNAFRHPLQGKPRGQDSEYAWLLEPQVWAMACGPDGSAVIVHDWHDTRAAMLRVEPRAIADGPMVHVIMVNGQIFQWGMDQRFLTHIIKTAQGVKGRHDRPVYREDAGAQPAPGQAEDNVVIRLECGHDVDLPEMPKVRIRITCSQDGPQYVTYWNGNEPMDEKRASYPYPDPSGRPNSEYPNRLSCGHIRILGRRYLPNEPVRCYACAPKTGVMRTVI